MQLKKIAVICNTCFWLTLIFQLWKDARIIQEQVLNTIVILGMIAVLLNLTWLINLIFSGREKNSKSDANGRKQPNIIEPFVLNSFNLLSFAAQVILISIKYL